jgi:hypothetical protein
MENYLDNYFGGNPVKEINKICDEIINHANKAGKVVDCGACKNNGCIVCEETNH